MSRREMAGPWFVIESVNWIAGVSACSMSSIMRIPSDSPTLLVVIIVPCRAGSTFVRAKRGIVGRNSQFSATC